MKKLNLANAGGASMLLLSLGLAACASMAAEPTVIVVGKGEIRLLGVTVHGKDELAKLLAERKISRVIIHPEADASYEDIGGAIYGISRSTVEIVRVDLADRNNR
jgi:hypothetical protein